MEEEDPKSEPLERFFNGGSAAVARQSDGGTTSMTLLSGPPSCGKTSLLFQFALNVVSESQGYVVFICSRRRLDAKPPFLSQGIDPSSDFFQRIQIKYVDDYDDECIKKYFAAFHLLHPFPLAVIVDDFGDLFHERKCQQRYNNARGRDLAMVRVLSMCQSAIIHANKTAACQLLLSDTHHGDSPRLLFIYKRWISSIFTIQGDGSGSFLLKKSFYLKGSDTGKRNARYSIAFQYLVWEGILEDSQL